MAGRQVSPRRIATTREPRGAGVLLPRVVGPLPAGGRSLPQLALGFVAAHPAVTSVLIGPRTPEQLDQLLLCADIALSPDTLAAIDHVVPPGRDVDPTNFVVVR